MKKKMNMMLADITGKSVKKINKDTDRNYWLKSNEAMDYGIVGKIITSYNELPH